MQGLGVGPFGEQPYFLILLHKGDRLRDFPLILKCVITHKPALRYGEADKVD